ncbi:MAG: hypothetical protein JXB38_08620 [Anaerolineales bacterium]|nr:hypothetical protein [Anaerolineales bacterium]
MDTHTRIKIGLALVLVLGALLAVPVERTLAADGAAPLADEGDLFDPLVEIIRELATGFLRFVVFLSGVIFIVSMVVSAARGSIGSAIGSQLQVSQGVMNAILAVAALVFVMVSIPLGNKIVDTLTEKLMQEVTMEINAAELAGTAGSAGAAGDLQQVLEIEALQDTITDFALSVVKAAIGVGVTAFIVAVALGGLDTQFGTLLGGSQQVSKGIMRVIGAVGAVIFLLVSYPLANTILRAVVPKVLTGITIPTPF